MKDFKILKFLDRFEGLFKSLGINYKVMRKILQLKLTMDSRRVPTIMANKRDSELTNKNAFKGSLIMYGLYGLFIGMFLLIPMPVFFKMNIAFGMIIFMTMATMISDFSAVLLDIKEKNILLPRPVDSRTINAAKLIHIFIYLFSLTASISGVALVVGAVKIGPLFAVIFFIQLIFLAGFVMFFTSILYFLILSVFDGEKLKDIINYFQIILTVGISVSYQFMGRIFGMVSYNGGYSPKWWHYLIPSAWFAAPYSIIFDSNKAQSVYLLSVISIVIPVVCFVLYFKVITKYFEARLQKLAEFNAGSEKFLQQKLHRKILRASLITFNKTENTFYRFSETMITRERKLKLKLYPSLAFAVVIPFIFMSNEFTRGSSFKSVMDSIRSSKYYLLLYTSVLMFSMVIAMMKNSERYKGAWIYKAMPIASPVPIFKGAVKAFISKLVIPGYLLVSAMFLCIYGFKITLDIGAIFLSLVLLIILIFYLSPKELPFCKDFVNTNEGNIGMMFGTMGYCGACAAAHYVLANKPFGIAAYSAVLLLLILISWSVAFKLTWKSLFRAKI